MTRFQWPTMVLILAATALLLPGTASWAAAESPPTAASDLSTSPSTSDVTAAATSTGGLFRALSPQRLLDNRSGVGTPARPLSRNGSLAVQVSGRGGVPATGAGSVVLNVTVIAPTAGGFVTAFADGKARPATSNLSFLRGQTVSSLVVVPLGTNGKVSIYNGSAGTIRVAADVQGYYLTGTPAAAGTYRSLTPQRLLDSRSGLGTARRAVSRNGTIAAQIAGRGGVPTSGVTAVVLSVTTTSATGRGFLTVYPNGASRPSTSDLNFQPGWTVTKMVVARLGTAGRISLFNGSSGSVQVVADVQGYYLAGAANAAGTFRSLPAHRLVDTRTGVGAARRAVSSGGAEVLNVATAGATVNGSAQAVVLTVTVTSPGRRGYVTVYPGGRSRPGTSNVNFEARQTVSNLVVVPVGSDGTVRLFNGSGAGVQVVVDVTGFYMNGAPVLSGDPAQCKTISRNTAGTSVTRWDPIIRCVVVSLHQSTSEVSDVETIIKYESSGDSNAINLWDSNAKAGHPSKGLVQVIQPTFDRYRTTRLPADLFSPAANIYAGMNYAIHTYGSIHNVPGLVSLRNGGGYVGYIVTK